METSSAFIERNELIENIKANIAYGGKYSVNTHIFDNKIMDSKCDGICIIEGGKSWIFKN